MLDKMTGLDPPGIKLRAAQGFDATDFFVTGYCLMSLKTTAEAEAEVGA